MRAIIAFTFVVDFLQVVSDIYYFTFFVFMVMLECYHFEIFTISLLKFMKFFVKKESVMQPISIQDAWATFLDK